MRLYSDQVSESENIHTFERLLDHYSGVYAQPICSWSSNIFVVVLFSVVKPCIFKVALTLTSPRAIPNQRTYLQITFDTANLYEQDVNDYLL